MLLLFIPLISLNTACDEAKQMATVAVPILEDSNPSWARPVDCDTKRVPVMANENKAFTDTIFCDINQRVPHTIEGTTTGGKNLIHDEFFQGAQCTTARTFFYRKSYFKLKIVASFSL